MPSFRLALAIGALLAGTGTASAVSVVDATGDFVPGFSGPNDPDLDVTEFSVTYDSTTSLFTLGAILAGTIDTNKAGRYVIGVDTGNGANAPFGTIGAPNVRFTQAFSVLKDGTALIGTTPLSVALGGSQFSVIVPLSLIPTTGFSPTQYGWNLWPRNGGSGLTAISDFAPDNGLLAITPVPEPGAWAMMLLGFGIVGGALRLQGHRVRARS